MNIRLTNQQRNLLSYILAGPLPTPYIAKQWGVSYNQIHHSFRRLEDRGLVRRIPDFGDTGLQRWELTELGRTALKGFV